MSYIDNLSRDNARTPMQWNGSENAGFTTGTPWIKVNPNYTVINAKAALADPDSVFYYYQKLIRLRHETPVIVYGVFEPLLEDDPCIYATPDVILRWVKESKPRDTVWIDGIT